MMTSTKRSKRPRPSMPALGASKSSTTNPLSRCRPRGSGEAGEHSSQRSRLALPVIESRGWDDVPDEVDDEEDEGDLSLSRGGPATVEELDLAPMVDVAFQLVLFFMVTATTILYKTLEIPKPSAEQAPTAVAQGRSLADLQDDHVLVEIDASGSVKIDREPVAANMNAIVERLRTAREKTNRKSMLLSADYATKHRDTVVVIDAAHEIGMNIVIARPAAPQGPAPTLLAHPAAAPAAPAGPPVKVAKSVAAAITLIELLVLLGASAGGNFLPSAIWQPGPDCPGGCRDAGCSLAWPRLEIDALGPGIYSPWANAGTVSSAGGENAHRHTGVLAGTYRVVELELRRSVTAGQAGFHDDPSCHLEHPPWQVIRSTLESSWLAREAEGPGEYAARHDARHSLRTRSPGGTGQRLGRDASRVRPCRGGS